MKKVMVAMVLCLSLLGLGCERPQVGGTLTVTVSNFSSQIPQSVFEAGLAFIQAQLTGHTGGVNVVLVPAGAQLRGDGPTNIVLKPGPTLAATRDGSVLIVTIPPGYDPNDVAWRNLLQQKLEEALR